MVDLGLDRSPAFLYEPETNGVVDSMFLLGVVTGGAAFGPVKGE